MESSFFCYEGRNRGFSQGREIEVCEPAPVEYLVSRWSVKRTCGKSFSSAFLYSHRSCFAFPAVIPNETNIEPDSTSKFLQQVVTPSIAHSTLE